MKKLLVLVVTLVIIPAAIVFGYRRFHHHDQKVVRHAKAYRAPAPQTLEAKIDRFQLATQSRLVTLNNRLDSLIDQARENAPKIHQTKKSKRVKKAKSVLAAPTLGRELRALDNRVWMARWDLLELDKATESSWPAEKKLTENYVTDLERRTDALEIRVRAGQPASTPVAEVARLMREERTPNGLVLMPDPNPIQIVNPSAKTYVEVLAEKEEAKEKAIRKLRHQRATRLAAKRARPKKAAGDATSAVLVVKAKPAPAEAKAASKVAKDAERVKPIAAPTLDLANRTSLNQTFLDPFGLEPDRNVAKDLSLQMSLAKKTEPKKIAAAEPSKSDGTTSATAAGGQENPAPQKVAVDSTPVGTDALASTSTAPKMVKVPQEAQKAVTPPDSNAPAASSSPNGPHI